MLPKKIDMNKFNQKFDNNFIIEEEGVILDNLNQFNQPNQINQHNLNNQLNHSKYLEEKNL